MVNRKAVEVYSEPRDGMYRSMRTIGPDATLSPVAIEGLSIQVRDFLPG